MPFYRGQNRQTPVIKTTIIKLAVKVIIKLLYCVDRGIILAFLEIIDVDIDIVVY